MTLDERLPFFILLATFPVAIAWYYFSGRLGQFHWTPLLTAATLAASGLLLWFFDSFSRKNKKMLDWTGGSAFFVGIFQLGALIPGCGRQTAALSASLLRNYSREAGARFAFFAAAPLLAASAYLHLRGVSLHLPEPALDLSWLSFSVAIIVSFFSGLLAIGGFMKHIQNKGMGQYAIYRLLLAAAVGIAYWIKTRA